MLLALALADSTWRPHSSYNQQCVKLQKQNAKLAPSGCSEMCGMPDNYAEPRRNAHRVLLLALYPFALPRCDALALAAS